MVRMERTCRVKDCSGRNALFHSFPKDECLRKKWIEFVIKTHQGKNVFTNGDICGRICGHHFREEDYENWTFVKMGFSKRLRLGKQAIPTLFRGKDLAKSTCPRRKSKQTNKSTNKKKTVEKTAIASKSTVVLQ